MMVDEPSHDEREQTLEFFRLERHRHHLDHGAGLAVAAAVWFALAPAARHSLGSDSPSVIRTVAVQMRS